MTKIDYKEIVLKLIPIFEEAGAKSIDLQKKGLEVKKKFSSLAKNQLRVIPDFEFYIDDSLDYIDEIDKALKEEDNPIK